MRLALTWDWPVTRVPLFTCSSPFSPSLWSVTVCQAPSLILLSLVMTATPVPQLNLWGGKGQKGSLINQLRMCSDLMDTTSGAMASLRANLFCSFYEYQEPFQSLHERARRLLSGPVSVQLSLICPQTLQMWGLPQPDLLCSFEKDGQLRSSPSLSVTARWFKWIPGTAN